MATDIKNDASLGANLVAYYKLDEASGDRTDSVNSYDLSPASSLSSGTGKIGDAADFGSASHTNRLYLASNIGVSGFSNHTINMWVKFSTLPATNKQETLFNKEVAGVKQYWNIDYRDEGGTKKWNLWRNSDEVKYNITESTGVWIMMTAVFDTSNDQLKLYRNTSLIATLSNLSWGANGSTTQFELGNWGTGRPLTGLIDEVGIWSKALTQDDITALYNSGSGLPYEVVSSFIPQIINII